VTLVPDDDGDLITLDGTLSDALDDPSITAVVPQHRVPVLARIGEETNPLVLRLGDGDARDAIYGLEQRLVDGSSATGEGEILVGVDFADEAGIGTGD